MRLRLLLVATLAAAPLQAQTTDTSRRAPGAVVSGALYDSLARAPLSGAVVQLVAADNPARFGQTVFSDSLGRYTVPDVPAGRYRLGFFHPVLDSLGVEPPLRELQVEGLAPVRADLAIPSPARMRAAVCGAQTAADAGLVIGKIFDARDGAPAAKVKVTGEWLELSFAPGGFVRKFPHLDVTTGDNGWFALCNVPSGGTMALTASRGADSTDRIEVQVPTEGFLRHELYLGAARAVVIGDTTRQADTLALPARRVHLGDGRLSGTVVAAAGGKPLAGALASIVDGPQARANERGEFTLTDAPLGTRILEVRAIGYYPVRRRVDVLASATPVHVALSTLKSVLDTVKVIATRRGGRDIEAFHERRRSGIGRYLTADEIMKRHPIVSSDIFRNIAGVRMIGLAAGERSIMLRGGVNAYGSQNMCSPAIFLNGSFLSESISADDIDTWVRPEEIAGIEIYNDVGIPAQFQRALSGCGAIVIWSKK